MMDKVSTEEKHKCESCGAVGKDVLKSGRNKYGKLIYLCYSCWENQWED